jgi:hypothetical protein
VLPTSTLPVTSPHLLTPAACDHSFPSPRPTIMTGRRRTMNPKRPCRRVNQRICSGDNMPITFLVLIRGMFLSFVIYYPNSFLSFIHSFLLQHMHAHSPTPFLPPSRLSPPSSLREDKRTEIDSDPKRRRRRRRRRLSEGLGLNGEVRFFCYLLSKAHFLVPSFRLKQAQPPPTRIIPTPVKDSSLSLCTTTTENGANEPTTTTMTMTARVGFEWVIADSRHGCYPRFFFFFSSNNYCGKQPCLLSTLFFES